MSEIGQPELTTQNRVIMLLENQLDWEYLGNWHREERSSPIEEDLFRRYLAKAGYSDGLIAKAVSKLATAAGDQSRDLYPVNKTVYGLLRYGLKVQESLGRHTQTVWPINWREPLANHFAFAEEVSVAGENKKRPDLVFYVNGVALAVLELKKGTVSVSKGIRQNLDNQLSVFIQRFFHAMQLVMAGNDTEGLRYGTIETAEKYYLQWKEADREQYGHLLDTEMVALYESLPIKLDKQLVQMLWRPRFLELIHDFIVFDAGVKKVCRPNQYFGVRAARAYVHMGEGGIIWHTQGSGKSLTMVWLAKWIRENVTDSRVLVITDRDELDKQIVRVFDDVDETMVRAESGADLIKLLNGHEQPLICSLVHKFGRGKNEEGDYDSYIEEIKKSLPPDFQAKGELFVFVDECHRTQSGKLHEAMKTILPGAVFIGFTGTPLLKKDKKTSLETFGEYIHTYKFNEAVKDEVVLDLRYEARDVDQRITDQHRIDAWFDSKTDGLNDLAKADLKLRWGTMQKLLSSKSRLDKIVNDILFDFGTKPRLMNGEGNAMLVAGDVYQACRYYELFQSTELAGHCAIVTSYEPTADKIKGESTGEGTTEELLKYKVYKDMLGGKKPEDFEEEVKNRFIKEPARMKLLIVVDKLLTGFDAPSATYLYIDKTMRDHGLFQAICRVNRLDGESKEYGFIIDYKDLFKSLEKSITDYTSEAFDQYDKQDVEGLLKDRLAQGRERLDGALEDVIALCEPVHPREQEDFIRYFCGDTSKEEDLKRTEERRVMLYKKTATLIRAFANLTWTRPR